jgi:hypothetical protein
MGLEDLVNASLVDDLIATTIDNFIEKSKEKPSFRAKGLHPSEVAGVCPRKVVLARVLPEEHVPQWDIDANLQRIFNDGHALHEWYQERYLGPAGVLWGRWVCSRCKEEVEGFMPKEACSCQHIPNYMPAYFCEKKCWKRGCRDLELMGKRGGCVHCGQMNPVAWGEWKYREPRIYIEEFDLVGHCDGLVCIDDNWYVLELKTANSMAWSYRKSPAENHLAQAAAYMYAFRQMPEPYNQVKARLIVYINKNGAEKYGGKKRKEKEFVAYWDEKCDKVIEDIRLINTSLKNKTLPSMIKGCSQMRRNRDCDLWEICARVGKGSEGFEDADNWDAVGSQYMDLT